MGNMITKIQRISLRVVFAVAVSPTFGAELAARYSFDNSANLGCDDSGNGLNLSIYGSEPGYSAEGKTGGAVVFDGSTQGFLTPAGILPNGSFSVAVWIKADAWGNSSFVTRPLSAAGGFQVYGSWDTEYAFASLASTGPTFVRARYKAPIGQWQHLVLTFQAAGDPDANGDYTGTLKSYIDGKCKATAANAKYNAAGTIKMCIGRYGNRCYDGMVDEYALYKGVLSESEILALAGQPVESK